MGTKKRIHTQMHSVQTKHAPGPGQRSVQMQFLLQGNTDTPGHQPRDHDGRNAGKKPQRTNIPRLPTKNPKHQRNNQVPPKPHENQRNRIQMPAMPKNHHNPPIILKQRMPAMHVQKHRTKRRNTNNQRNEIDRYFISRRVAQDKKRSLTNN